MSANHLQSFDRAVELVTVAAEAGANAVKLQTYRPDTLTIDSDEEHFLIPNGSPWAGHRLFELYAQAQTPWEWHNDLKSVAHEAGITLFSSPFDRTAIDFLATLDVPAYKIASFELVDHALIAYASSKGRPLIMSTGMASVSDIDEALTVARRAGANDIALMRCNSAYPAPAREMDLRTIPDMAARWGVPIGLSDHTLGAAATIAAVTLGACIIEKHITLRRDEEGPDAAFSAEPSEFVHLVTAVREAEAALGAIRYGPSPSEQASVPFRRSLFVVADIAAGETFTDQNVRAIRPNYGLPPKHLSDILGRSAARHATKGTPMKWELIASAKGL